LVPEPNALAIRVRVRTIFKIWQRRPMDSENKIAVIIRING